ncbi:cardiolipin synthase [Bombilactobacillus folatiphilus]|uniref:Cardiolipin synthase n=1 Tax=Bombilactobacillus folatiphilus TaxID=2923362 RepID=A0ABY4P953_9LACO|nr:cardiolipin synthase [Bombilactobacillus folatiphilus]UQS82208.1 cardiolipin synthase [Bombilactobacillus folatiphilus]
MQIFINIVILIFLLNTIAAIITVFHRRRSISTTLAWLIVLILLPIIGFIIFAFFGRGIAQENLFAISNAEHVGLERLKQMVSKDLAKKRPSAANETTKKAQRQIDYFNQSEDAPVTVHNQPKIFTDGKAKFAALEQDIKAAKETIHLEYYSFFDDDLGRQILQLLTQKAQEGLEVRVIYDRWGSPGANKKFFKPLMEAGGQVMPFITSQNAITKYRLNYHLHRKIVVIDGKIGWTGGFNIGDQYLGLKPKFGYWRDTHVRIVGYAALSLQERFVLDWNASVNRHHEKILFQEKYFPINWEVPEDITPIQIVSDGPDNNFDTLKGGLMSFVMNAQKSVLIQTPYLIPDDSMLDALLVTARSGTKVKIMIPDKPDHPFIYRATQFYANLLSEKNIEVYIYNNGFMHAKTAVFDHQISAIGSMNQDYRSYSLNFEADAFLYDTKVSQQLTKIFEEDIKHCTLLTMEIINQQSRWLHFKQLFSRLLSPIL